MINHLSNVLCIILVVVAFTTKAHAVELGLTPSHVYGLWLNINNCYLALQKATITDDTFLKKLEETATDTFQNKKPADVYKYASKLQANIAKEFNLGQLPPLPDWVEDFDKLNLNTADKDVTPSEVFLLSSWFLNQLTQEYVSYTNGEEKISGFYKDYGLKNKQPKDVFALVDLLNKRQKMVAEFRKSNVREN